ncbi:hypothetical protein ACTMU2_10130 [Cupriavidus basilensis]
MATIAYELTVIGLNGASNAWSGTPATPGTRLGAARAFRARTAGQRDQRDIALAHGDRLRGVRHMHEVRRPAGLGGVDMAQLEAQVVDHIEDAEPRRVAGAEVTVDIG